MRIKQYFIIIVCSLFITACESGREKSLNKIKQVESEFNKIKDINKQGPLVYDLDLVYLDFVKRFPEDSLSPVFLYRAFENNVKLNWNERAMNIIDQFVNTYPNHPKAPELLFYKAYLYDEKLNNDAKAGEFYRLFIQKYPGHPLVKDAEGSIKFLGLSPEETLRRIEQMNAAKDSAATNQ